ncbi:hypothetical protein H9L05_20925 (plasmid) [Hymenobacter qilianensis]|uniref:Uncharacterized protein n=1 Tax=Hymenobacter qilianensis TaxID=1385715 RepID=A0A7H0H181_9BACT|nr:hypothetical protein [Hymenobacter qilianensis]QNP54297.1 hypothetical protein H9L05_20925 [Hymenobacter qilianensis]
MAARQGMFRYDGRQLVPLNQLVRQGPRLRGEALRVVADSAGTVWVGMHDGLYAFVPATGELRPVPLPRLTGRHGRINALLLHRGTLWFGRGMDPCQVFRLSLRRPQQSARLVWQYPQGLIAAIEPDSAGLLLHSFERSWRLSPGGQVHTLAPHSRRYRVQQADGSRRTQLADHPLRLPNSPYFLTDSVLYEHRPSQPRRVLARWRRNRSSAAVPRLNVLELDSTWYWLGDEELLALSIRRQRQAPELQHYPLPLAREWNGWLCFNRARTGLYAFAEGMPGVIELRPRRASIQALPVAGKQRLSTRAISRLADGRLLVGSYSGTFTQAADSPLAPCAPGRARRPAASGTAVCACPMRAWSLVLKTGGASGCWPGGGLRKSGGPGPTPSPRAKPSSACCATGPGGCGRGAAGPVCARPGPPHA